MGYVVKIEYKDGRKWLFSTDNYHFINSRWTSFEVDDGSAKYLNTEDMEVINIKHKEDNK